MSPTLSSCQFQLRLSPFLSGTLWLGGIFLRFRERVAFQRHARVRMNGSRNHGTLLIAIGKSFRSMINGGTNGTVEIVTMISVA